MICSPYGDHSEKPVCSEDKESEYCNIHNPKSKFENLLDEDPSETVCGISKKLVGAERIAGGTKAPPSEWPWLAMIRYQENSQEKPSFECGGSLISKKTVMTAAHCLQNRSI